MRGRKGEMFLIADSTRLLYAAPPSPYSATALQAARFKTCLKISPLRHA